MKIEARGKGEKLKVKVDGDEIDGVILFRIDVRESETWVTIHTKRGTVIEAPADKVLLNI